MKVLLVNGTDYSAVDFKDHCEEEEISYAEIWDKANEEEVWTFDDGTRYFEVQALEFGDVDPEFIQFLYDEIIDEDLAKHCDFFIIEE